MHHYNLTAHGQIEGDPRRTSPHSPVTPVPTTGNAFVAEVVNRTPSPWKCQGAFVKTSSRSAAMGRATPPPSPRSRPRHAPAA